MSFIKSNSFTRSKYLFYNSIKAEALRLHNFHDKDFFSSPEMRAVILYRVGAKSQTPHQVFSA